MTTEAQIKIKHNMVFKPETLRMAVELWVTSRPLHDADTVKSAYKELKYEPGSEKIALMQKK